MVIHIISNIYTTQYAHIHTYTYIHTGYMVWFSECIWFGLVNAINILLLGLIANT